MKGWERDVWDLSVLDAWHLSALKYRIEWKAARQAVLERDLAEVIGLLAELLSTP